MDDSERPIADHGYAPLWVVHILEDLGVNRQTALTLPCDEAVREMTNRVKERLIAEQLVRTPHAQH